MEKALHPKVSLQKVGVAGGVGMGRGWLRTAESLPEAAAESVVPSCAIVLVQMITVASGCASSLGGMVKGLTDCNRTQPQSLCHWWQTRLLRFPILSGLCSHLL